MAELDELPVRLLDINYALPFKDYAEDMFEAFQARQKQYLMRKILTQQIDLEYY